MKLLLPVLAACLAQPVMAESYGPPAPISFVDAEGPAQPETLAPSHAPRNLANRIETMPTEAWGAAALHGLDYLLTDRCVRKGTCEEGNPAMKEILGKRPSTGKLVGAYIITTAMWLGGVSLLQDNHPKAARTVSRIGLGITAGTVVATASVAF